MNRIARFAAVSLLCGISLAQAPAPTDGYVPTAETAIQIAKVVLKPIVGEPGLKSQEPFHAELHDGVWEVGGRWNKFPSTMRGGGGVYMRIRKQTGEILGYYFNR
jgi:hypothetical protein